MAIQELDVWIFHRSDKITTNADALSRAPIQESEVGGEGTHCDTIAVIVNYQPCLKGIIDFLELGILPSEEKQIKIIAFTQSQYRLADNVLYHVQQDGSLRVIPPVGTCEVLFYQAHGGVHGGHLGDKKVYSEL